jgi:hypothetical protein
MPPRLKAQEADGRRRLRAGLNDANEEASKTLVAVAGFAVGPGQGGAEYKDLPPELFVELLEYMTPKVAPARKGRLLGVGL